MTTAATNAPGTAHQGWFTKTEAWLDDKGKGAWIAAMVLGFVFFWPVGLALLFYMIWSKRMFNGSCRKSRRHARHSGHAHHMRRHGSSGNTAFDAYKEDTLRRLEDEQDQFEAFLQRLREAKDKTEFDQFMEDRAFRAAAEADADTGRDTGENAGNDKDEPARA
ncbi:DUF2852 domain-containing protein [Rhodobacteraceae bacterium D3-12]|nr:DUF2852 domain-containing protein [Rhodobacteraceae bacterium D3-12]